MITKINILFLRYFYTFLNESKHMKLLAAIRLNILELMTSKNKKYNFRGAGCVEKCMHGSETEFNMVTYYPTGLSKWGSPFSPKELEARIRSVLKRVAKLTSSSGLPLSGVISFSFLQVDLNKRQVYKNEIRIRLTGMEFSLLELLVSRSGQAFSRADILQEVWGYTPERHVDTRVVDVHISRLRAKLESDPSNPDLILTARGTGYLFQRITDIT
jgi:DNA-binding winged helix-turn-helix (wHTH) protein